MANARMFTDAGRVAGYSGFAAVRGFPDYEQSARVELEVLRLHREWPISRIVITSEMDVLRAGRLRTHLGLPGQGGDSALAFRNKLEMKRRLSNRLKSVRVPAFAAVGEGFDIIQFVEEHGYPIIVKPVDGFGSARATPIRDEDELAAFLERGVPHGLEVETFVTGRQYHIDGLVIDGEIVFCWPSRYLRDSLYFTEGGITAAQMLSAEHPLFSRLREATKEILDILPTPRDTSFHLELFHTPNDELFFCEVASRTGGARINPMLKMAFGIDVNRAFVRLQAGLPVDVAELRALARSPRRLLGWGAVPTRAGVFAGARAAAPDVPWIVDFEWGLKKGARAGGPETIRDNVASFIVEFEDDASGEPALLGAWKWVTDNAMWASDDDEKSPTPGQAP
ncbi:MAG: hypothetical protein QM820_34890 [Minicystis sp.]